VPKLIDYATGKPGKNQVTKPQTILLSAALRLLQNSANHSFILT